MQSPNLRNGTTGEWKTPTRVRVRAMYADQHMSIRQIEKSTGVPRSTVARMIHFQGPRRVRLGRSGPRFKISKRLLRRLIRKLRSGWRGRTLSLIQLGKACGIEQSESTIRRALAKQGYHRCVACPRPFINRKQQKRRLQFARSHIDWILDVLKRVIWTDECSFETGRRGRIWVTRLASERFCPDCVRSVYRSGHVSFMVWGAIGWGYKSPLVFMSKSTGKGINSKDYRDQVLIPVLTPAMAEVNEFDEHPILMEDGAKIHAGNAKKYRLQQGWETLSPWPPSSPDFNPIEKVWRWMKHCLTVMEPFPLSLDALKAAVQRLWDQMDPNLFMGPVEQWSDIMEECIAYKGLATHY
jgi:hypothetical protein